MRVSDPRGTPWLTAALSLTLSMIFLVQNLGSLGFTVWPAWLAAGMVVAVIGIFSCLRNGDLARRGLVVNLAALVVSLGLLAWAVQLSNNRYSFG